VYGKWIHRKSGLFFVSDTHEAELLAEPQPSAKLFQKATCVVTHQGQDFSNERHSARAAVSAAHQIMAKFCKLRIFWEKKSKIFKKVGLGIGISRGPMFLGNVGSSKRLDYTVIGPDVNIAQRLASETESGQILITDRVHATLSGKFPVRSETKMLLRGMESQVTVYSLSDTE
jgi:class 3 adenylate cyclase